MLLLFFYPTRILRRLLSAKCVHNRLRVFIYTFIEKFLFCYRDGLDGTKDMRSFSGVYFLLRVMVFLAEEICRKMFKFNQPLARGLVFSIAALLIALSRPYKKTYVNIVDSILLSHLAILCYIGESLDHNSTLNRPYLDLLLMQIMLFLPFLVVFLVTTYRLVRAIVQHFLGSLSRCLACLKSARTRSFGGFTPQNLTTYGTMDWISITGVNIINNYSSLVCCSYCDSVSENSFVQIPLSVR